MFNLFVRKQAAFCSNFLSKNTAIKQFSFNNNSKYIKQSFLNINKKNFSNLPSVKTTYKNIVSSVRKQVFRRVVFFRILFFTSIILIIFTTIRYTNNLNFGKNITPTYFLQNKTDANTFYNLAGVIKPGSILYVKGTDELSFELTDYEHVIKVFYKGPLPTNFLEGNTCIVTGTITDPAKPSIFLGNKIMTDHSYNSDKWMNRKLEKGKRSLKDEGNLDKLMGMTNQNKKKYTSMN